MRTAKKKSQKKILIVEDEHPIAKTLELKLSHSGYSTLCAFNGAQALDLLKKDSVDLILLDLVMPEMDGFALLEELRNFPSAPPVMVLTNLGQEEDAEKCKNLGACDYFIKAETPLVDIVDRITRFFS